MPKINIDRQKCKGCLLCVSFCPKGLIKASSELNKRGVKPVEFSRRPRKIGGGIPPEAGQDSAECLGCMMCAVICPDSCIEVYK